MTVEKALAELNEYGFHIVRINTDQFECYDTGLFGFAEQEDPFVVDGDELLDIYEQYIGENKA